MKLCELLISAVLVLCFMTCSQAGCPRLNLRSATNLVEERGEFRSPEQSDWQNVAHFVITARQGWKIAVQFDRMDLSNLRRDNHRIVIRDGCSVNACNTYKMKNGILIEKVTGGNRNSRNVEKPVRFISTTSKLCVSYYSKYFRSNLGFSARYETYPTNLCPIDDLADPEQNPSCENYKIAPLAANCTYDLGCGENYVRKGNAECIEGYWEDNVDCLLNPTVLDTCIFEDDRMDCPFSRDEISRYFEDMNADDGGLLGPDIGRSGSRKQICREPCRRRGKNYAFHCRTRYRRKPYARFLCYRCRYAGCTEVNKFVG